MNTLILDLIDKIPNGYLIRFYTKDNIDSGVMVIPTQAYDWFIKAPVSSSKTYELEYKNGSTNITITKKIRSKSYCMKIEFMNNVLYIPNSEFNTTTKTFCFQTYIDIRAYDNNGQLEYSSYRFLKNYDTRSKAIYFIEKFAYRFTSLYKKWFIKELFHGNIIYEHAYMFKAKDGNGTAIYTFTITSVEKG